MQVNSFSFTYNSIIIGVALAVPLTDIIRQSIPQKHSILKVLLRETEPETISPKLQS